MWPFKKKDPTERFWTWFAENCEAFRDPPGDDRRNIDKLGSLLSEIREGLVVEFSLTGGRAEEIVISADGKKDLFAAVIEVVQAAPPIPGWRVTAFRQPGNPNVTIEMNGMKLGANDIWFSAEPSDGKTDLLLLVRGMTEENHQMLAGAVFVLLDNALGEFIVETALGDVNFGPLSGDPAADGLRPLTELRACVERVQQ
jgi:hypothetical protein